MGLWVEWASWAVLLVSLGVSQNRSPLDPRTLGPLSLSLRFLSHCSPCDLSPVGQPKAQSRSFQTFSKRRHTVASPPSIGQSSHRPGPYSRGREINFTSLWRQWPNLQPSSIYHQENGYLEAISSLPLMSLQDKPPHRLTRDHCYILAQLRKSNTSHYT